MDLHHFDDETQKLAERITRFTIDRLKQDPPSLHTTSTKEDLKVALSKVITKDGLGGEKAFDIFENIIDPANISTDHPRYLAYVPNAPANAASLFDLVVSACSMIGTTWLEASGAVAAENQALRFISDMIGYPSSSGGVFVSGGTAANLSALLAARHRFREVHPEHSRSRLAIACAPSAHSSIKKACEAMDIDIIEIVGDEHLRLIGKNLESTWSTIDEEDKSRVFCVVASAGATNSGYVDDLEGVGEFCAKNSLWFHVDGAYGGAGILCESTYTLFKGIEKSDSFIVDPHKWLFSPYDSAALIYKDPEAARRTHIQHAEYLEAGNDTLDWNPSDYAHHLTRRARGLPFWFMLAVHGTDAISQAITGCINLTQQSKNLIEQSSHLDLVIEPQLSVILFRRTGWKENDYRNWCDSMLKKEFAFIMPTKYKGESVLRFCIVNPVTTLEDIELIISTLE